MNSEFGIWCEETDSLPEGMTNKASFAGKTYDVVHICDIIHSTGTTVLGEYQSDFYKGMPAVTENSYGKGKAYYVAFRNDGELADDFCKMLINTCNIEQDCGIKTEDGISVRKRGDYIFVMNFSDDAKNVIFDKEYTDVVNNTKLSGSKTLSICEYLILK